jgi:WD40 repeat protein
VDRACDYVRQAALGLQYAFEQGMVHRDLKPHNLMLTPDGRVKILDFGLAHFASEAAPAACRTGTGVVLGTVDYIAPEQADNAHQADIRSDIYSLGCTLYHLLAGQPPYPTGTPIQKVMAHLEKKPQPLTELRQDIPEELMHVIDRMMAKEPKRRYQTPIEVAIALERFTRPSASDAGRSLTLVLPKPPAYDPSRRRIVALVAALFFIVAGLLGGAVYRIATDKGELVITTESDDVKVVITQGGKQVDIIDAKTDKQIRLALRSGEYELELEGAPKGLKLNINNATLTRGKETLAKIERRLETKPEEVVGEARRFLGHQACVWSVAISPDGRLAASGGGGVLGPQDWSPAADHAVLLWDLAGGGELRRFHGHEGTVTGLGFSPDSRLLASAGSHDQTVRIWEVATGMQLHCLRHNTRVERVEFLPAGGYLVSCGFDGLSRVWDTKTGKQVRTFEGHKGPVVAVSGSVDGRRVASGSDDKTIRVWEVETGKELRQFPWHTQVLEAAAISFGGGWSQGGLGRQKDAVAISPDGRRLLSADGNGNLLRLWDVESRQELRRFDGHSGPVFGIVFTPDGRRALSGSLDETIRLWDVETGKELRRFTGHTSGVFGLAISPDGRHVLSGSNDKTVRLWRLPDPPPDRKPAPPAERVGEIRRFGAEGHRMIHLALSPDGQRLLTASVEGSAQYWDIATGKEIYRLPGAGGQVYGVAISPDGTKLLSCGGDRLIHVWDAANGQEVKQLKGHTDEVHGVAISPDGRIAASSGNDCQLRLWNLDNGELIASPGNAGGGLGAAFSPDGKLIATWANDHMVRLWDVKERKELRCLEGHKEWVAAGAFSRDGSRLLTGTWPPELVVRPSDLKLWEVATGKLLRTIDVIPGSVHGLAISPDGRQALSGGASGLVQLWDLERGQAIMALTGHIGHVSDVAFLPGGRTAVSVGFDATIRLWRLPDPPPAKENP